METIEDIFIKEQDFAETMETKIQPFLHENIKDGYFTNKDGRQLYYQMLINPSEKASIVISHGYCEFSTKYAETMYYFYEMGYSVFIMDHRGHGLSDRQVSGFSKVHIDKFSDYVSDFNDFVEKLVLAESLTEKLILFGHSMGGGIGALYLEQYPDVFSKAILSSPMIKLNTGTTSIITLKLLFMLSYIPGVKKMYLPGYHDYDHQYKYPRCSALSKARYTFQFEEREREMGYRTNGCTFGWAREAFNVSKKIIKNANSIKIPVILMQAALDRLVVNEEQNKFFNLVPSCKLMRFEGSKHEIFNATDDIILDYYTKLFEFIDEV